MESTAVFTNTEKAGDHLKGGPKGFSSLPLLPMNPCMNHEKYDNSLKIVSIVSLTTNYLAPLTKLIHDNFAIMVGLPTSGHPITSTQKTVDGTFWKAVV